MTVFGRLGLGKPVQVAYKVPDFNESIPFWTYCVGAGPFITRQHIEVNDVMYRGRAASFDHSSAYGQWGDVMVELVVDHTPGDSVFKERPMGLHHLAFIVDDLPETLFAAKEIGLEVATTAQTRSTKFAFIDAVDICGHFLEVYPRTPSLVSFYEEVRQASLELT